MRTWRNRRGWELRWHKRGNGGYWVVLLLDGRYLVSQDFEWFEQQSSLRMAEALAGLGAMREVAKKEKRA